MGQKRGLPRTAYHAAGAETFRTIAYYCRDIGIPYLRYAFSTENWKRPVEEVATIMDLLHKYLLEVLEKMERDGFLVHFFGNLEPLPLPCGTCVSGRRRRPPPSPASGTR